MGNEAAERALPLVLVVEINGVASPTSLADNGMLAARPASSGSRPPLATLVKWSSKRFTERAKRYFERLSRIAGSQGSRSNQLERTLKVEDNRESASQERLFPLQSRCSGGKIPTSASRVSFRASLVENVNSDCDMSGAN